MTNPLKRSDMLRICVIDGQGGGIGSAVIKRLKEIYGETIEIIALGTNAITTSQMLKAHIHSLALVDHQIFLKPNPNT